jgi:hypothetical protein
MRLAARKMGVCYVSVVRYSDKGEGWKTAVC